VSPSALFHPLFVSLEGPDGSGKTTQANLLAERLSHAGFDVVVTREPGGGGPVAAEARRMLLHGGEMTRETEVLLFFAARAENVANVIRPALSRGQVVLCDRYTDSTLAYQGAGLGMEESQIRSLHRFATGDLWPHATIVFDLPPDIGLERQDTRNRMEERGLDFARRVRDGFLALADADPQRCRVVDAVGSKDEVHERVWGALAPFLEVQSGSADGVREGGSK
jgi:dTMP kinase